MKEFKILKKMLKRTFLFSFSNPHPAYAFFLSPYFFLQYFWHIRKLFNCFKYDKYNNYILVKLSNLGLKKIIVGAKIRTQDKIKSREFIFRQQCI